MNTKLKKPLIETRKIRKYFPLKRNSFFQRNQLFVRAVEELSIAIYKGETLGLVGESGCGKSTLGRIILQLYEPTSGDAVYHGISLEDFNPAYIAKEIQKISKYQQKAIESYQKAIVHDNFIQTMQTDLKSMAQTEENAPLIEAKKKELEKHIDMSKKLKEDADEKLLKGAKTVGSLILESDIQEIAKILLDIHDVLDDIRELNEKVQKSRRIIRIKEKLLSRQKDDKDSSELTRDDIDESQKDIKETEIEIASLKEKYKEIKSSVEKYRGKNPLPVTEKAKDPSYRNYLDNCIEKGINLTRLKKEEMRVLRQKLQIIFQDPYSSLDPRMTVGQIIEEAVVEHGMFKKGTPELEEYIISIMAQCGLDNYMIHRYPHQFSGGQRQRIGIARALALRPEFVVADEAVSALDVSIQSQIINLLEELKEASGLTYLFISHDLSVIRHISDRIGVMYLGHMVELGDSEEVYNDPFHPYTKALLSAIPTTDLVQKERILLQGDIPSNIFPPSGCKFRTRCPIVQERCAKEVPEYREITPGHFVACHFYEKTASIK